MTASSCPIKIVAISYGCIGFRDRWLISCPRQLPVTGVIIVSAVHMIGEYEAIKAIERHLSVPTSSMSKLELLWPVFRCDFYEYTPLGSTSTTDGSSEC
eukprot:scaffold11357_cov132-Skeletonema_dohrnii-CCMP3373.AAC.1